MPYLKLNIRASTEIFGIFGHVQTQSFQSMYLTYCLDSKLNMYEIGKKAEIGSVPNNKKNGKKKRTKMIKI